ncbi:MAG: hypothetical protein AAGA48_08175 [Myxococcota bacterium]
MSATEGTVMPSGWYASGTYQPSLDGSVAADCNGYTTTEASREGSRWADTESRPTQTDCASELPLLCCD